MLISVTFFSFMGSIPLSITALVPPALWMKVSILILELNPDTIGFFEDTLQFLFASRLYQLTFHKLENYYRVFDVTDVAINGIILSHFA